MRKRKNVIYRMMFILVFISCELAGRVGNEFEEIGYMIGQFKWYLFPFEIQQLVPIIIINAQQKMGFECFGSAICDRETFKNVSENIEISYYSNKFSAHVKGELFISFYFMYTGYESFILILYGVA